MSDGFLDFTIGENDDKIGKKTKKFTVEDGRSYRVSFAWVSLPKKNDKGDVVGWDDRAAITPDGKIHTEARIRFTGCERLYKQGVGYFLYKGPAYAQFGQPRQYVATILVVWPTSKDGDLDAASYKAGKGWTVQPWIFSTDKYNTITKSHKRFPLTKHDMALECPIGGSQYQKVTFTPEGESLLAKLMESGKPEHKAVVDKIFAEVRALSENIHREMARDLTIDQIKEALGESVETPTGSSGGSHSAKNVDDILGNVLDD
jgi:hypothetical protein